VADDDRVGAPDVSVIIPTRNRSALLERLLRQLFRADNALTYEIIVVDEGSTDETPALLGRLREEHDLFVIRHDVPLGLCGARNAGTNASRGRYIGWIDDDDLTSPDRLRRQYDALEASGLRWSCAGRIDIDDELAIIGHMRCPSPIDLRRRLLAFNVLPTAAQGLLVERRLCEEVGGYDTSLDSAEDWEHCIRLFEHGEPHLLDEPLVGYRTGVESMSTDTKRMERAITMVLDKHSDLRASLDVQPDWASIHASLLAADLLTSRRSAMRRAYLLFREAPGAKNAVRIVAVPIVRNRINRISAERRRSQVPDSWVRQARDWLDDVHPLVP
jgi:glycosyltransferase involved in cell wall biosynthesis